MIPGYRIIRELGRGGMATVYLAEQESLGREVALKVLNPALAADADFAERFLREARIAGSFRHRHLIPVLDAGRHGEALYLAMEYVPNGNAGDLRGGDPDEIRRCLIEVASGLAAAHAKGVVHRDLKPENILRREDGSYVLSDFGIARSQQATRELTGPQAAIGTPSYMSPEQWRGEAVDGRADLYSLGIVAFELLTGQTPFRGDDGWAIGLQHMNAPRPLLPPALADWQPVLDRLLAVERAARFDTANELIAALGGKPEATPRPLTPAPQAALHPTTPLPARSSTTDRRRLVVALVVAGVIGLTLLLVFRPTQSPPAPAATSTQTPPPAAASRHKSVAVLPFRVISSEAGDTLFADGLSEEMLASLAAIPELKVPGRTSSFAWKDKSADVREIAKALGVAHVLEGSIRRSGARLRIVANLIGAEDGATLWSQTFDRDSEDVFAIQNEIAIAVSDRLAVQIGTRVLPTLARLPAEQRARYLETIGGLRTLPASGIAELEHQLRDIESDGYAGPDLYVRLLQTIAHRARNERLDQNEVRTSLEHYQRVLAERFPGSVEALLGEALVVQSRGDAGNRISDYEAALKLFEAVLERAPNEVLAATQAAFAARTLLRLDQAIVLARRAVAIDPEDAAAHFVLANALGSAGQGEAAASAMRDLARRFPESGYARNLSLFLAGNGQLADAVMVDRHCVQRQEAPGCEISIRMLRLLGFERQADIMLSQRPESMRLGADGYDGVRLGRLPDPAYAGLGFGHFIEAMAEAIAQRRIDLASAYMRASSYRLQRPWQQGKPRFEGLDMRAAAPFVCAALIADDSADLQHHRDNLAAITRTVRGLPPKAMPYPTTHWALGAEMLSGNMDAAFRRLDGMADLNPLNWQHWVISPSGREMPTAKILRADPRFAAIWQRREALIERERARLKELWPEIE